MLDRTKTTPIGTVTRLATRPVGIVAVCALLSACGPIGGTASGPQRSAGDQTAASGPIAVGPAIAPLSAMAATTSDATGKTVAPVVKVAPIPTPMETFKALTHDEGVQLTPLFTTPATSTEARLSRLEGAVQTLQNNFDSIMPTMVRMVSMEQGIKDLVGQLRTLNGEGNTGTDTDTDNDTTVATADTAPNATMGPFRPAKTDKTTTPALTNPAQPAANRKPQALTPSAPQKTGSPVPATTHNTLHDVRIADHGAWTRLVVDMGAKADLPATLGQDGKTLTLHTDGMAWGGQTGTVKVDSALIDSYRYENGQLTITLRRPATVVTNRALAPYGKAGWRAVIDLAPASR